MERVKVFVDWKESSWVAGAEAVGHFGKGKAESQQTIFNVSVVERRQRVKDRRDFVHAVCNDITREGNVTNRGSKEFKTADWCTWDPATKRIDVIFSNGVSCPKKGFSWIKEKTNLFPFTSQEVVSTAKVVESAGEGDVIEEGEVEDEVRKHFLKAKKQRMKDKGEE